MALNYEFFLTAPAPIQLLQQLAEESDADVALPNADDQAVIASEFGFLAAADVLFDVGSPDETSAVAQRMGDIVRRLADEVANDFLLVFEDTEIMRRVDGVVRFQPGWDLIRRCFDHPT